LFFNDIHYLPAWLHEINNIRNKIVHYDNVKPNDISLALIYVERIAEIIKDIELQNGLKSIMDRVDN
jgi:abortive infection bacteriophage resistance protein